MRARVGADGVGGGRARQGRQPIARCERRTLKVEGDEVHPLTLSARVCRFVSGSWRLLGTKQRRPKGLPLSPGNAPIPRRTVMRALWIAGSAAVLASCLAASASANPIRLRPSWHVQSIQRNASGDCGSLPSGTGILRDGDFSQAPNPGNDTGVGPGTTFAPHWMSSGPRTIDFYGTGS